MYLPLRRGLCGGGIRVPGGPRLPGLYGGGGRRVRTGTTGTTSSDSIYVSYIWVPRVPREPGLCVFDSQLLLSVLLCVCCDGCGGAIYGYHGYQV